MAPELVNTVRASQWRPRPRRWDVLAGAVALTLAGGLWMGLMTKLVPVHGLPGAPLGTQFLRSGAPQAVQARWIALTCLGIVVMVLAVAMLAAWRRGAAAAGEMRSVQIVGGTRWLAALSVAAVLELLTVALRLPIQVTLVAWVPVLAPALLQLSWLYRADVALGALASIALLQAGHMEEHVVQVFQLAASGGKAAQAHGILSPFDQEVVHLAMTSAVWLVCLGVLIRLPRNPWLWAAAALASLHEVEHGFMLSMSRFDHLGYVDGGINGLLAGGGLVGGPMPRPYTHFLYNLLELTLIAAALAFEIRRRGTRAEPAGASEPTRPPSRVTTTANAMRVRTHQQ